MQSDFATNNKFVPDSMRWYTVSQWLLVITRNHVGDESPSTRLPTTTTCTGHPTHSRWSIRSLRCPTFTPAAGCLRSALGQASLVSPWPKPATTHCLYTPPPPFLL